MAEIMKTFLYINSRLVFDKHFNVTATKRLGVTFVLTCNNKSIDGNSVVLVFFIWIRTSQP